VKYLNIISKKYSKNYLNIKKKINSNVSNKELKIKNIVVCKE